MSTNIEISVFISLYRDRVEGLEDVGDGMVIGYRSFSGLSLR
jgi:hypothetical protein